MVQITITIVEGEQGKVTVQGKANCDELATPLEVEISGEYSKIFHKAIQEVGQKIERGIINNGIYN